MQYLQVGSYLVQRQAGASGCFSGAQSVQDGASGGCFQFGWDRVEMIGDEHEHRVINPFHKFGYFMAQATFM